MRVFISHSASYSVILHHTHKVCMYLLHICVCSALSTRDTGWQRLIGSLIFVGFFRKSDLYLVALLWKMICDLEDPMSLRHLGILRFIRSYVLEGLLQERYVEFPPHTLPLT